MPLQRSVRYRIAGWNTLAVAIVALAALAAMRQAMNWALWHEIDLVLIEDANEVRLGISQSTGGGLAPLTDELQRKALGHQQHGWFVRLITPRGDALWQSCPADHGRLTAEGATSQPLTIGDVRSLTTTAPTNSLDIAQVQVGSSLEPLRAAMSRIDRRALIVLAAMLALAPLIGYWLAGIATKRLALFTASAAALRPSEMSERLPDRGIGDEFDRLAETINRLLDRIATFLEEKRNFLDDIAHELRTPIAAIRSAVEVALAEDRSQRDYRELLEQVLEDSDSLEVLVNQVLLLSEAATAGDAVLRNSVDLSAVVRRSCEMFAGVAEQRNVNLVADIDNGVVVRGNRHHLSQLANNLIDNAIKYTRAQGNIRVSLRSTAGVAELIVQDTGAGIAEDDLPRIFDRFFRAARARSRDDTHGIGLGLSICKTIVSAHGGTIECQSQLGQGARFTVRLPIIATDNAPPLLIDAAAFAVPGS